MKPVPEPVLQHASTCPGPNVHVTKGITRLLMSCRACGAELVVLGPPR